MIDYALEQQLADVKKLLDSWNDFRDFYKIGENKQAPTKEQEESFLDCKKQIAMLHDGFMDTIPISETASSRKKQKDGKAIIESVVSCVTIKHIHTFYSNQHKEFEKTWNDSYMLLTESVEKMEAQKEDLAGVSYTQLAMNEFKDKMTKNIVNFFKGPLVRYGGSIALIIFIPFILHVTGVFDLQTIPVRYPRLAKVYYPLERAYRKTINGSLKFVSLDHTTRYKGELPPSYAEITPPPGTSISEGIGLMKWTDFGPELDLTFEMNSSLDFRHEAYKVEGGQDLNMLIYLLPTNSDALNVEKKYRQWLPSLDSGYKSKFESENTFFRKNNVIVVISSKSESARRFFKTQEWQIID